MPVKANIGCSRQISAYCCGPGTPLKMVLEAARLKAMHLAAMPRRSPTLALAQWATHRLPLAGPARNALIGLLQICCNFAPRTAVGAANCGKMSTDRCIA